MSKLPILCKPMRGKMTSAQQKIVDKFHERVISLIYKRRRALYNPSGQIEWEGITNQIDKIEDERRAYIESLKKKTS
jgi:hypothetical protein